MTSVCAHLVLFVVLLHVRILEAADETFVETASNDESISELCQRAGSTCEKELFGAAVQGVCANPCDALLRYFGDSGGNPPPCFDGASDDGSCSLCKEVRFDPDARQFDIDTPTKAQCGAGGPKLLLEDLSSKGKFNLPPQHFIECDFSSELSVALANGVVGAFCLPVTPLPSSTASPTPSPFPSEIAKLPITDAFSEEPISNTCRRAGKVCDPSRFGAAARAQCLEVCNATVVYFNVIDIFVTTPNVCAQNGTGIEANPAIGEPGSACTTCRRLEIVFTRSIEFTRNGLFEESETTARCKSAAANKVLLEDFLTKIDSIAIDTLLSLDEEECSVRNRFDLHSLTVANEIVKTYCVSSINPSPTPTASPKTIETLAPRVRMCVKILKRCLRKRTGRNSCCTNLCKCLENNDRPLPKKSCTQLCEPFMLMV